MIIDTIPQDRWDEAQKYEYETWKPHVEVNPKEQPKHFDEYFEKYFGELLRQDWTGKTVLEIGTGIAGSMWIMNASRRIGVEPLADKLKVFNPKLYANYEMISHGAESVPEVADQSVDCVVTFNVLDHCQDVGSIIAEINRILKPGCRLAIGCDLKATCMYLDVGHPIALSAKWFEKEFEKYKFKTIKKEVVPSRSIDTATGKDFLDGCLIYIGEKLCQVSQL